MIRFGCPSCKTVLQAAKTQGGAIISCPRCQQKLRVPAPVAVLAPPVSRPIPIPIPSESPAAYTEGSLKDAPPYAEGSPEETPPAYAEGSLKDAPPAYAGGSLPQPPPPAVLMDPADSPTPSHFEGATQANMFNDMHGYVVMAEEDERDLMGFLAPAEKPDEIGRLGPYRVLTVLGAGGMGVVFKAEDPRLERPVAIKAMLPSLAASAMSTKRFLREAKLAARIKHNNIVTIYSVDEDQGVPYLAMEFLEGESLEQRLKRDRRLPLVEAVRIGREIADGLAAAHEKTLIHRDIKPANIWLEATPGRKTGEHQVKILDFGLARTVSDQTHLTQSGAILGTPAYMAPEQFGGKGVDQRCDVFSLGCVLYVMCTGELPFKGADTMAILQSIAMNAPTDPAQLRTDTPPELSRLILRMLAKKAEDRPAAMHEVADQLREIGIALLPHYLARPPLSVYLKEHLAKLRTLGPIMKTALIVAWQHAQCGLVKAANFTEKGVVYLLHRARLGPTLDKALPQGTRQRRPVLVGLAALVVFLIVLGPYLLLRHRDDTGMPIVQEDPSLPTPVVAAKAPPLSMVVQLGHADSLTSVALSHDGRFLATGSKDSTARLWEVATGKELRTFKGHAGAVTCVAFSEDDATLATGSADWTARLWNVADGQEIHQFHQHSDAITSVIFSRDGKWLITTAGDKTARKWDLATKDTKTLFKGHTAAITSAALSADGKWLATGSADKSARIWDLATGIEPPPKDAARFFTHPAAVTAVAFSKEGKWLATACADRIARVFKTEMGQEFRNFTVPPKSDMRFVAFSLDNKTLISGGDKTRLWDLTAEPVKPVPEKPGKEMQPPTLPGSMSAMLLSKDGQWLVTANADGGADRTASIRELPSGKPLRLFQGQAAPVQCVAFSRDGKWLVTGSDDKSAHLWKMPSGTELRTFPETSFIRSAALSPDGRWLLVGRGDGIRLWDTASFKDVRTFAGTGPLSLNGSGTLLATAQNDNAARLWELASGKEVHVFKDRHAANITSLALSADGNWLVTASSDKTWLWDASKGQEVHAFPVPSAVLSVAIAGDGKRLVTGSDDNSARLWDAAAVKEIRSFKDAGPVRCLALSADGKWLATAGSNDGNARLWDVDTGSELCIFRGHAGRITSLAMSNDRRYLASSSADGTTRLWDLASGRELCRLISFRDQTWAVVDSEGRYDSFNDGNAAQGLYWIDGLTITPIETQTRDRFHDSGLLAKYLNFNADRPRSLRE